MGRRKLRSRVSALLTDLGWEGLFELELIEREDGGWHAIDMNPRPYGSMALAIGAGCNLPALWCRHLLGAPVACHTGYAGRALSLDRRRPAPWPVAAAHG